MSMYKKVIVAVDMEGGARDVINKASQLLADNNAEIKVMTVVYTALQMYGTSMVIGDSAYLPENLVVDNKTIAAEILPRLEAITKEFDLPGHQCVVEFGRAIDVILDTADEEHADLVVIGSHGRHGLGLLLGSTANGVLHRAKCDVLAVRIQQ